MASLGARISGIGAAVPKRVLTNHDLAKQVDTTDEWIVTRTGIKERHIASHDESTSDLAVKACLAALEDAGIEAKDVECIVLATASPDYILPSTACLVQERIGAHNAAAFDVSAVCSGFVYALSIGSLYVKSGEYNNVLVVGADVMSRFLDWKDRTTCVLFGDGAGAVLLSAGSPGSGVKHSYLAADGKGWDLLYVHSGGARNPTSKESLDNREQFLRMNGAEVFKFAVRVVPEICNELLRRAGMSLEEVAYIVPHQANQRILVAAAERLDFPRERIISNLERYGNTSTASIPLVLEELDRAGRLNSGDCIITVGFGAGLTWGGNLIKWDK